LAEQLSLPSGQKSIMRASSLEIIKFDKENGEKAAELMAAWGMPKEATMSYMKAKFAGERLLKVIRLQRAYTPDKRKSLILTRRGTVLTSDTLAKVDNWVLANMIPYDCVSWIAHSGGGTIWPTISGLSQRLSADPRLLKTQDYHEEHLDMEANIPYAVYKCILHFWNGEVYDGLGSIDLDAARASSPDRTISMIIPLARSRAFSEAARKALGLVSGAAEEDVELNEGEISKSAKTVVVEVTKTGPPVIENVFQFLARAKITYNLKEKDILAILKIDNISKITNFIEAWSVIEKHQAFTNTPAETPAGTTGTP
jgi:hypothetical protein